MAVNAPEFRWSKARNFKSKMLQTCSVTEGPVGTGTKYFSKGITPIQGKAL